MGVGDRRSTDNRLPHVTPGGGMVRSATEMPGLHRCSSRPRLQSSLPPAFARLALLSLAAISTLMAQNVEPQKSVPKAVNTITAVPGIKVGHHTLEERPTGCTVVLAEGGAVAGVTVSGSAPGTRETDLLDPINMVQMVHAIVLAGGSAFGLDAASGTMRYLEERSIGFETRVAKVPIVPAAILFDLGIGDPKIRPGPDCGYRAAAAASQAEVQEGNVGAGAGATLGKIAGIGRAMKGGLGSAAISLPGGLVVGALAAVNSVGDVIDPSTGQVIAGALTEDRSGLADARKLLRAGLTLPRGPVENTTLVVVATNARLSKPQAAKMARMADDGLSRAVVPAHTPSDGDTVFALATGTWEGTADLATIGALAAEAVSDAIVRAAREATGIPGFPAARDLRAPDSRR
jgi:L-aminopeptidase/D-esterase-like protein